MKKKQAMTSKWHNQMKTPSFCICEKARLCSSGQVEIFIAHFGIFLCKILEKMYLLPCELRPWSTSRCSDGTIYISNS